MADGFTELDAIIARIRQIPELARRAAPDVALAIEAELERNIAAGTSPEGVPWAPTKAGGKPLTKAANAIAVVAVGATILVKLTGPEARHHLGNARGRITRQIIPTDAIPQPMADKVREVITKHFEAATHG